MTRRGWGLVAALAVCVGLLIVGARHGADREAVPFGFNDNAALERSASATQDAELLSRVGATVARVQFDWATAEPWPRDLRLETYDAIHRALRTRGIKMLLVFAFAPPWATAAGSCARAVPACHAPPDRAHFGDASRTVAALARRYDDLAGIEIWNEPNTAYFWAPRPDPDAYAELLARCAQAAKQADADVRVVAGAVANSPSSSQAISAPDFLRAIVGRGAVASADAFSVHVYPAPGDRGAGSALQSLRDATGALGGTARDRPIWITETGVSTTGPRAVSPPEQARSLVTLVRLLRAQPRVEAVLLHTLIDPPRDPAKIEAGFGVVDRRLRPKPSFCALEALLTGRSSCAGAG